MLMGSFSIKLFLRASLIYSLQSMQHDIKVKFYSQQLNVVQL